MSHLIAFILAMIIAAPSQQLPNPQQPVNTNQLEVLRNNDKQLEKKYPGFSRFQRQLADCGQQLKEQFGEPVDPQDLEACITYARYITDTLDQAEGK